MNRIIQILFFVLIPLHILAGNSSSKYQLDQWSNLNFNDYKQQRIACEKELRKLKWQYNVWPEGNKTPKPNFKDVFKNEDLLLSVNRNLKKEAVLVDYFSILIGSKQIQDELNRMVSQTKDPERLKSLFGLFENNPYDIAECIVRPNLVSRIFKEKFDKDKKIHHAMKQKAEFELSQLVQSDSAIELSAQIYPIRYHLQQYDVNLEASSRIVSQLSIDEWQSKLSKISQKQELVEKNEGFVFEKLIHEEIDLLDVDSYYWPKTTSEEWLASQYVEMQNWTIYSEELVLGSIKNNSNEYTNKSLDEGQWFSENVPLARERHSAIWTGNEMIIWGGNQGDYKFNSGGKYNPVTDTWLPVSLIDAPEERMYHTAIWTGTEMIIWGGTNGGSNLNTGGRYNPLSDTWLSTSIVNAPFARYDHTVVWTGDEMIIWGGFGSGYLNTGARYNPGLDLWSSTQATGAPTARTFHTAVWTGTEMIIWSGNSIFATSTGGRYNPQLNSWQPTNIIDAPVARAKHTAIWTGTEMIVWGGYGTGVTNEAARYNPDSDSWQLSTNINAPTLRSYHTAIWSGTEMIVWGGSSSTGGIYNPVTDSWSATQTINAPSFYTNHTSIWNGSEMIIWGGFLSGERTNKGGRYNPLTNSWTETSNNGMRPSERRYHTAVWTGNEFIIWGGYDGGYLQSGARYNPAMDNWLETSLSDAPTARKNADSVWSGLHMVIWGGVDPSYKNTGGRYNPVSDTWETTSTINAPVGRQAHTTIWTGSEMIIWGGYSNGLLSDGGKYNPFDNVWNAITSFDGPSPRQDHSAIWTGEEMIIWGGYFSYDEMLEDGGQYNPITNSWQQTGMTNTPGKRSGHAAVWTGEEMIVWGGTAWNPAGYEIDVRSGKIYNPISKQWQDVPTTNAPYWTASGEIWTGSEMLLWDSSSRSGSKFNPSANSWTALNNENAPISRLSSSTTWTGRNLITWGGYINGSGYTNVMGIYEPNYEFDLSVNVVGLESGDFVSILSNGLHTSIVSSNGSHILLSGFVNDDVYEVAINSESMNPNLICELSDSMGVFNGSDIQLEVTCEYKYKVILDVTGLASENSLDLLNDTEILSIEENGYSNFINLLSDGDTYNIFILSQPNTPNQICSLLDPSSGSISGSDKIIQIECVTVQYEIGFTVIGLLDGNSITISVNGGYEEQISNSGSYQFSQAFDDGESYLIDISSQPSNPIQVCNLTNENVTLNGSNVNNVIINCQESEDLIFRSNFD